MNESCMKQGYLKKKSMRIGTFRKRWMVLKDNYLYSYKNKESYPNGKPTESIDLKLFKQIRKSCSNQVNQFELISNDITRVFIAKCMDDLNDWFNFIQQIIDNNINEIYSKLIDMGFQKTICMKAAKKYPDDINKAANYILISQNKINDDIHMVHNDDDTYNKDKNITKEEEWTPIEYNAALQSDYNNKQIESKTVSKIKNKQKWKLISKGNNDEEDEIESKNDGNNYNNNDEESDVEWIIICTEDLFDTENKDNDNDKNKSGFSSWTESLNSMLTHSKHRMYTILATPSFKKYCHNNNNQHVFSLSHDVWIMGDHYIFNNKEKHSNRGVIRLIAFDIYSKIWITYRSKFPNILSSRYTSDAGWGCMLRTAQMMTAQALIIYYFDYKWKLTDLHNNNQVNIYYDDILSLFNDDISSPLSIHNMILYGSSIYNKPVGHWYGPMQSCVMIKKCIENNKKLTNYIECIICDSGTIYKSDISLTKHSLIFLPLRLGLDSINIKYIDSILQCFHLKQCIGIIGGKPKKSLYFIGYQNNNLFYLDPHTVFPTPNISKPLSIQKCIFHCKEINSLFVKQLDPSMTIAFFIKPSETELNKFWETATKLMTHQYSIFSLTDQPPST